MKRQVILIAILVIGAAISAYVWTRPGENEVDQNLAAQKQEFVCEKCGTRFELTVAESTAMYRSETGVTCPNCKAGGAEKTDVKVRVSGFASEEDKETAAADETGESAKSFGSRSRAQ